MDKDRELLDSVIFKVLNRVRGKNDYNMMIAQNITNAILSAGLIHKDSIKLPEEKEILQPTTAYRMGKNTAVWCKGYNQCIKDIKELNKN